GGSSREGSPKFHQASPVFHPRSPTLGPASCTVARGRIAFLRCFKPNWKNRSGPTYSRLPTTTAIGHIHSSTIHEMTMNTSASSPAVRGLVATAVFGFLGLDLCVVATADPSTESRIVKFADLKISDPSDAHVLYRRIQAAAQVVCSHYFLLTDTDKAC